MENNISVAQAIEVLQNALSEDKSEGSYYYGWQANIAMTLFDEIKGADFEYDDLHKVCNNAAKIFLDRLINTESKNQMALN